MTTDPVGLDATSATERKVVTDWSELAAATNVQLLKGKETKLSAERWEWGWECGEEWGWE